MEPKKFLHRHVATWTPVLFACHISSLIIIAITSVSNPRVSRHSCSSIPTTLPLECSCMYDIHS